MIEYEQVIKINWYLDPNAVKKILEIKKRLTKEDWLPLKEFEFGTLGYDYEEGLKFEIPYDKEKLRNCAEWLKKFHRKYKIPFIGKDKLGQYSLVTAGFTVYDEEFNKVEEEFFTSCTFIKSTFKYEGYTLR
jgi:hypothetical protein